MNSVRVPTCSTTPASGSFERVGAHGRLHAGADPIEVGLRNEDLDVRMRGVRERHHRRARTGELARLEVNVEDVAGSLRAEDVARETLVGEGHRGDRAFEARARACELLAASSALERRLPLLERLAFRGRALDLGVRAVDLRLRDGPGRLERVRALGVLLEEPLGRDGGAHLRGERGDVLAACAGLEERNVGARGLDLARSRVTRELLELVVDLGERLLVGDHVSALHVDTHDAPGELEGEDAFLVLDDPLVVGGPRGLRGAAEETARGQDRERHGPRPCCGILYHTSDNSTDALPRPAPARGP